MDSLLLRRRMMMQQDGGKPYDARIEYLQSDGSQYIDIDFLSGPDVGYSSAFELLSSFSQNNPPCPCYCQGYNSSNNWGCIFDTASSRHEILIGNYSWVNTYIYGDDMLNQEIDIQYNFNNSKKVSINNSMLGITLDLTNVGIYAINILGGMSPDGIYRTGPLNCKFKSLVLTNGADVVRDLIPVRVGQVGYLYDKVSKQLFGNSGSGAFILGPDK